MLDECSLKVERNVTIGIVGAIRAFPLCLLSHSVFVCRIVCGVPCFSSPQVEDKAKQSLRQFRTQAGIDAQEHLLVLSKQVLNGVADILDLALVVMCLCMCVERNLCVTPIYFTTAVAPVLVLGMTLFHLS